MIEHGERREDIPEMGVKVEEPRGDEVAGEPTGDDEERMETPDVGRPGAGAEQGLEVDSIVPVLGRVSDGSEGGCCGGEGKKMAGRGDWSQGFESMKRPPGRRGSQEEETEMHKTVDLVCRIAAAETQENIR